MATFKVRPVTIIDDRDIGRGATSGFHKKPNASATFPANTLVQITSGEAENLATGDSTNLALAEEAAVDNAYVGAGTDFPRTKPDVRLRYLKGKRIGITVLGTWNSTYIGQKHPVKLDTGGSGYAVVDPSDAVSTDVVTILELYGEQVVDAANGVWNGKVVSGTDTNAYVIGILDDSACYTGA